jgi:hypothetical protein
MFICLYNFFNVINDLGVKTASVESLCKRLMKK